jgi:murein DD-endopeptidase MepM/ murein hydrolase activator NlpD
MFDIKKQFAISLLILLGMGLSSCGWVEVPAKDGSTYKSRSPSAKAEQASKPKPVFIPGTIIVEKGDTVYGVSRQNDVSVRAIIDINNLKAPFHINEGQRLRIPQEPTHVVRAGDTLYSVSRSYNTDVYTLAKTNKLKPPFTLTPGQRLTLPTGNNLTTASQNLSPKPIKVEPVPVPSAKLVKAEPRLAKTSIPQPPKRESSRFAWPLKGKVLSSFGSQKAGLHNDGLNIAAERGTPVKAAENGVVAYSGNELRGFGNMILVKHSDGWITAYAHNENLLVKRGQTIKKGQTIASVGSSGGVTTPQLHFEIRKGMKSVDPTKFLGG